MLLAAADTWTARLGHVPSASPSEHRPPAVPLGLALPAPTDDAPAGSWRYLCGALYGAANIGPSFPGPWPPLSAAPTCRARACPPSAVCPHSSNLLEEGGVLHGASPAAVQAKAELAGGGGGALAELSDLIWTHRSRVNMRRPLPCALASAREAHAAMARYVHDAALLAAEASKAVPSDAVLCLPPTPAGRALALLWPLLDPWCVAFLSRRLSA
jgi:hypothetical protein